MNTEEMFLPDVVYKLEGRFMNELIDAIREACVKKTIVQCRAEFAKTDAGDWVNIALAKKIAGASKTTLRKFFIEDGEPVPGKIRYIRRNDQYSLYNRSDIEAWKTFKK